MEKRYQIFISSTFTDLEEERRLAIETIMNLGHFPIGMELFNAANDSQWEYIKRKIDEADYYILILGDRYGSVDSDGISFTEKEYRYALSKNMPTISFVMSEKRINELNFEKRESNHRDKLNEFRQLAASKMCRIWSNEYELMSGINSGLYELFNVYPRNGWIKASNIEYDKLQNDYISVLKENEIIKEQIESLTSISKKAEVVISKFKDLRIQIRDLQLTGLQILKYFTMFFSVKKKEREIIWSLQRYCENVMNLDLNYKEVEILSMLFFKYNLLGLEEYDKGENCYPRIITYYTPKPILHEVIFLLNENNIENLPVVSTKKKKMYELESLIEEYTNISFNNMHHDEQQAEILQKIIVRFGTKELMNKYSDLNNLMTKQNELFNFFSDLKELYME